MLRCIRYLQHVMTDVYCSAHARDYVLSTSVSVPAVEPKLIDERAVSTGGACMAHVLADLLNTWNAAATQNLQLANLNLVLSAMKSQPSVALEHSITARALVESRSLMLHVMLQLLQLLALRPLRLSCTPDLLAVRSENESLDELLAVEPSGLLLRWVNFRLSSSGVSRHVNGWGDDWKDSVVLGALLGLGEDCGAEECVAALRSAGLEFDSNLGWLEVLLTPKDVSSGMAPSLCAIAAARLFRCGDLVGSAAELSQHLCCRQNSALPAATEQQQNELASAVRAHELLEESDHESRSYARWISSLLDTNVKDLFEAIRSGVVLLQLLELVQPGCVDWKQGHKKPKGSFKCIENCCLAVTVGKQV